MSYKQRLARSYCGSIPGTRCSTGETRCGVTSYIVVILLPTSLSSESLLGLLYECMLHPRRSFENNNQHVFKHLHVLLSSLARFLPSGFCSWGESMLVLRIGVFACSFSHPEHATLNHLQFMSTGRQARLEVEM